MDYFQFYRIPITFVIDQEALNKRFFEYNKLYQPQFFSHRPPDEEMEKIELSGLNIIAFRTLSDKDKRMKYLLQLKNVLHAEDEWPDETFIKSLQSLEGSVKDALLAKNADAVTTLKKDVQLILNNLYLEVEDIVENYNDSQADRKQLESVKKYYLKRQYLLRIKELLDNFAD